MQYASSMFPGYEHAPRVCKARSRCHSSSFVCMRAALRHTADLASMHSSGRCVGQTVMQLAAGAKVNACTDSQLHLYCTNAAIGCVFKCMEAPLPLMQSEKSLQLTLKLVQAAPNAEWRQRATDLEVGTSCHNNSISSCSSADAGSTWRGPCPLPPSVGLQSYLMPCFDAFRSHSNISTLALLSLDHAVTYQALLCCQSIKL